MTYKNVFEPINGSSGELRDMEDIESSSLTNDQY